MGVEVVPEGGAGAGEREGEGDGDGDGDGGRFLDRASRMIGAGSVFRYPVRVRVRECLLGLGARFDLCVRALDTWMSSASTDNGRSSPRTLQILGSS